MMKPEMNDELVMGSEIICYLVKRFLSETDAVIPFATQLKNLHLLQEVILSHSVLWGWIDNLHCGNAGVSVLCILVFWIKEDKDPNIPIKLSLTSSMKILYLKHSKVGVAVCEILKAGYALSLIESTKTGSILNPFVIKPKLRCSVGKICVA